MSEINIPFIVRDPIMVEVIRSYDATIADLRSRLDSAERENERLLIENRRWVPRIEITGASATAQTIEPGKANDDEVDYNRWDRIRRTGAQ